MPCWCAGSIASTKRRCSTSSPTAASSRRWPHPSPATSRRSRRDIPMRRRTFIAGLAASLSLRRIALAQPPGRVPEVVLFYTGPVESAELRARLIREDLAASGLVEGKNFALTLRVATGNDKLPQLASELV